jgi:hypothetical protein
LIVSGVVAQAVIDNMRSIANKYIRPPSKI